MTNLLGRNWAVLLEVQYDLDNSPLTGHIYIIFLLLIWYALRLDMGGVWRYQTGTHFFSFLALDQIELSCRRHIPFSFIVSFLLKADTPALA